MNSLKCQGATAKAWLAEQKLTPALERRPLGLTTVKNPPVV